MTTPHNCGKPECAVCSGKHTHEELLYECRKSVKEVGWCGFGVGGGEVKPTHLYTAGLSLNYGHPELCIMGVPAGIAHTVIGDVAGSIKAGTRLVPGDCYGGYLGNGYKLKASLVDLDDGQMWDWFGVGIAYNELEGKPIPEYLQLLWPDEAGVFPGEPGCSLNDDLQFALNGVDGVLRTIEIFGGKADAEVC